MEITGALWLVVTWIEGGRLPLKCCTQRSTTQSRWYIPSLRRGSFQYFVTSMVTVGARTFSCMVATYPLHQRTPVYSRLYFQTWTRSSSTTIHALEIKNLRNLQLGWPCLTSWSSILLSTLWKHLSVETMWVNGPSITSAQRCFNSLGSIFADHSWFTTRYLHHQRFWKVSSKTSMVSTTIIRLSMSTCNQSRRTLMLSCSHFTRTRWSKWSSKALL